MSTRSALEGVQGGDDLVEVDQHGAVVRGLPLPAGGFGGVQEFPGEIGLLLMNGQELGGGLEIRAGQAPLTELTPNRRWSGDSSYRHVGSFPGVMESEENGRDLAGLVVARVGRLVAIGEEGEPYRLIDASGGAVEPAALFLRDLLAAGRSAATLRSYGMDLLRWWRFLHAVDIVWDRATRMEARDFSCWIQLTVKQRRLAARSDTGWPSVVSGAPNSVTGKAAPTDGYAPATVAHSETVLRGFYDFHRDAAPAQS